MGSWRFRKCPRCGFVAAAGRFEALDFGSNWKERGSTRRRCPNCGYRAPTSEFRVVREKRATA